MLPFLLESCLNSVCSVGDESSVNSMFSENLPEICQFWGTNAIFSIVKVHQKVGKFAINWPKFQSLCKKAHRLKKKDTIAGGGGGDKYML